MYKLSERNLVIKFYKCLEHAFCVLKSFLNFVGKTRSFFVTKGNLLNTSYLLRQFYVHNFQFHSK